MIDLNSSEYESNDVSIFNGGEAGLVKNVTIRLEKKKSDDHQNAPDYKLFIVDENGDEINQGFYRDQNNEKVNLGRVKHLADAVVGEHEYPKLNTQEEAVDYMMKLVAKNCGDKKFNVFTNYGNSNRPSEYLQLRFFNFIQPADSEKPLTQQKGGAYADIMERIIADEAVTPDTDQSDGDDWFSEE